MAQQFKAQLGHEGLVVVGHGRMKLEDDRKYGAVLHLIQSFDQICVHL